MKTNFLKIFTLVFAFGISSCSSDDSGGSSAGSNNYLPLSSTNYWTYDIDNEGTLSRDSLFVGNDTLISGVTYKKMKTDVLPNGFYSSTLKNNGLRVDGKDVKMTGATSFNFGLGEPLSIGVSNFTIVRNDAAINELLGTVTGTFSQTVSDYPLDFTYSLKSYNVASLPSFTSPNGDQYNNVIQSKVVLNLKITTTQTVGGFPITITVLAPQDVVVSNQYFAKNIGMVHTNSKISYELQSLPGVTLPIPSSFETIQNEYLDTYLAN